MEGKNDIETALKWAYNNLLEKSYYCNAIENYVRFSAGGIKHAVKSKTYPTKIKLIYQAVEMLQHSELIWNGADKKNRKDVVKVYHLKSSTDVDGKQRTVFIVLREMKDGVIYYDHNTQKKP